ncbi:MAG: hypothetical protein ACRD8Z_05320, partial [Nitrososphaeraceae archaeon]
SWVHQNRITISILEKIGLRCIWLSNTLKENQQFNLMRTYKNLWVRSEFKQRQILSKIRYESR